MSSSDQYQALVNTVHEKYRAEPGGANADYIPFLANIPSDLSALAIVTNKGEIFQAGDSDYRFAIESISKMCTLVQALEDFGAETVREKIGAEATGLPFNSVMALELHGGKPLSPLVNAGAIATASLIKANSVEERWQRILGIQQKLGSSQIALSDELNQSEQDTNFHNRAIAWLLYSAGYCYSDPMEAVDVYTRQCSTLLTVVELATMGATLANGGVNPVTKERVMAAENTAHVMADMAMEGMYDTAGDWLYNVGLPAKSGVGGGIVSVVPGVMGIAAFSPPLDPIGNSVRGQKMVAEVAKTLGHNMFVKN